jgi:hypothetical protein
MHASQEQLRPNKKKKLYRTQCVILIDIASIMLFVGYG